jgi:Protein of unknown function (DUF2612)
MTMIPYDPTIQRALKWQHNKAPKITSMINQKASWYDRYNAQFWSNWEETVFDLRTANPFGLVVWCIILGLPLDVFDFQAITNAWAYGRQRGNYMDGDKGAPFTFVGDPIIYQNGVVRVAAVNPTTGAVTINPAPPVDAVLDWSGIVDDTNGGPNQVVVHRKFGVGDGVKTVFNLTPANIANYNDVGYNFQGGGATSVAILNEIRFACQLRYCALVSNGRQQWINEMLRFIFNGGDPWDMGSNKYFYLTDGTQDASAIGPMKMEYHVGAAMRLSAQFINLLNTPAYGIVPNVAGVKYVVIQD